MTGRLPPEIVITMKSTMVDSCSGICFRFDIWNVDSKPLRLKLEEDNNYYHIGIIILLLCQKVLMGAKYSRLGVAILHTNEIMGSTRVEWVAKIYKYKKT